MAVTASDARRRLLSLIDEVDDDQVVEIVSTTAQPSPPRPTSTPPSRQPCTCVQSPKNAQRLRESLARLRDGAEDRHKLIE